MMVNSKFKFSEDQWIAGDLKSIELTAPDTTSPYHMLIKVKHEDTYGFQNLYVRTHITYPSGKTISSVTSLELADAQGRWAGNCGSQYCNLELVLQDRFTFPETGKYIWAIEPYMRTDTVQGIAAIAIQCRRINE
jgi:gliding motility-associated lipoprotein GldH